MGLDMYASTTNRHLTSSVDLSCGDADQVIHQWRKHPNLHGWVENVYRRKGGSQEFNCTPVQLTIGKCPNEKLTMKRECPSTRATEPLRFYDFRSAPRPFSSHQMRR